METKSARPALDRRGLMTATLGLGVTLGLGFTASRQAWADTKLDAATNGRLPDGTAFAPWDQPLSFSKTYVVDNTSPQASDEGPGDMSRPFRTIGRAAQVLQPGERVVIAAGTYRECIRPARGGSGPSQMISYEAAPGAKVVVKGSESLRDGWRQETVKAGMTSGPDITVWRHDLTEALFPDAYNPFALPSIMTQWQWLDTKVVDIGPFLRRRGLVFVDGKPLEPMEQLRELAMDQLPSAPDFTTPPVPHNGLPARRRGGPVMQEIGGRADARFWADESGTAIYVRLSQGTPADHLIEVTTRQHTLIPTQSGIDFIRIKGLIFQHGGNAYPFPQHGMVSLAGGDHWILEDNTIEWANGIGLDIGRDGDSVGATAPGKSQIVRRNTIRYCGVEGLGGMGTSDTLIEDNLIEWCGWADAERGWEAAGAKFHGARNMMFRRNVIRHIRHGNAVWWDSENANCRITGNIFADVLTVSAALHMEMNRQPNTIDNNIIWDVRNAEPGTPGQRGCAGSGIFDNATDNLLITQNLIGKCENSGIFTITRPDRVGSGTGTSNVVANNIFAQCGTSAIVFLDAKNQSDANTYIAMPDRFLGFYHDDAKDYLDLATWRQTYGWDKTSQIVTAQVGFDADTLQLTFAADKPLAKVRAVGPINGDLLSEVTGAERTAGPLAHLGGKGPLFVDPRRPSAKA